MSNSLDTGRSPSGGFLGQVTLLWARFRAWLPDDVDRRVRVMAWATLVSQTTGCRSMRMTRGIETPTRFVLLVEWDSVAAHEDFRASERFGQWRALIGPHFAGPPVVEHFADL